MSIIFIIDWQEKLPPQFKMVDQSDKEHTIKLDIDSFESELTFINEIINQYNREQAFANLVSVLDRTKEYAQNAWDGYPGLNLRDVIGELYKTAWLEHLALSLDDAIDLVKKISSTLEKKWVAPEQPPVDQTPENVDQWPEEIVLDQSAF